MTTGLLVAFEGLDQSGKQTQAELLQQRLAAGGRTVRLLSFPDYETPIGSELRRALHGEHEYAPDVMQLLYVANRYEWKERDPPRTPGWRHSPVRPLSRVERGVRRGPRAWTARGWPRSRSICRNPT